MNSEMIVKGTKFVVNACVNRTVVDGIDTLTRNYGDSTPRKIIKFIGREGLGIAITCSTKKIIDETIDEVADKIADVVIKIKENK